MILIVCTTGLEIVVEICLHVASVHNCNGIINYDDAEFVNSER